jgi:hypothetical protein
MTESGREKPPMNENLELTEREVVVIIEGSLKALVSKHEYFYRSGVGPQYSKLTPEGIEMLIKSMSALLPLLADAQHRDLQERAKQMTFDTLAEEDIQ